MKPATYVIALSTIALICIFSLRAFANRLPSFIKVGTTFDVGHGENNARHFTVIATDPSGWIKVRAEGRDGPDKFWINFNRGDRIDNVK